MKVVLVKGKEEMIKLCVVSVWRGQKELFSSVDIRHAEHVQI
jgi:hypothetical protein